MTHRATDRQPCPKCNRGYLKFLSGKDIWYCISASCDYEMTVAEFADKLNSPARSIAGEAERAQDEISEVALLESLLNKRTAIIKRFMEAAKATDMETPDDVIARLAVSTPPVASAPDLSNAQLDYAHNVATFLVDSLAVTWNWDGKDDEYPICEPCTGINERTTRHLDPCPEPKQYCGFKDPHSPRVCDKRPHHGDLHDDSTLAMGEVERSGTNQAIEEGKREREAAAPAAAPRCWKCGAESCVIHGTDPAKILAEIPAPFSPPSASQAEGGLAKENTDVLDRK